LWEWTGKGQAFKTDKQKNKKQKTKQSKAKTKRLSPSDSQTGQSQIRHNRLQFQISCFAGSIRGCSNAKEGNEVKLAKMSEGAAKCSSRWWKSITKRKGTKGQTMIYKTLHRKQMIEQHLYVYPRENEVAFLCEFFKKHVYPL